jgi:hypothetical protein
MIITAVFTIFLFMVILVVVFVSGRRFERDKWALCKDCSDLLSRADVEERDGMCRDCRRKLWGEMLC